MANPIKRLARKYVEREEFPSVEWLIHRSGKLLFQGFVNSRHSSAKLTLTDKPIYRIYSMTKPIVAFAALIAIENDKIKLYDNVEDYIESFKKLKVLNKYGTLNKIERPIRIEDLLTHRSGLSYGFNRFCPLGKKYASTNLINESNLSLKDFVDRIARYPLAFQPGAAWRYSLSTDVLARVLEIALNDTIENILSKYVLNPLEMLDTFYSVPKTKLYRLMPITGEPNLDKITEIKSSPTNLNEIDINSFYSFNPEKNRPRGGHGLFSTTADYHKFANMLLTGQTPSGDRLISSKMLRFSLKNRISKKQRPLFIDTVPQNGYGWNLLGRIMKNEGKSLILANKGEYGWAGAAATYFWIDPEYKLTGIVMSQHLGSNIPLGEEIRGKTYSLI